MAELPHGYDWPPLEHGELILSAKSRSRERNAGRRGHVPTVIDSFRPGGRLAAWFGIGEPQWWLPLDDDAERKLDGGRAWRLRPWARVCRRRCDLHDRGYALDSLFTVLPYLVCRRCGHRLEWPNLGIGRRVLTHNWQSHVLHRALGLVLALCGSLRLRR